VKPDEAKVARRSPAVAVAKSPARILPPAEPIPEVEPAAVRQPEMKNPIDEVAAAPTRRRRQLEKKPALIDARVVDAAQMTAQGSLDQYPIYPRAPTNVRFPLGVLF
jgi:hypothetical protein